MKINKTLVAAFALLLVAGILAVALMNKNAPSPSPAETESPISKSVKNGSTASGDDVNSRAPERARTREIPKDQELVEKYGESRTNLSRQVSNTVISILDDAVQMGEMIQAGQGFGGPGGRGGLGMALGGLNRELALTEEQKNKASKILSDYQKRQLNRTKDALDSLKKNPTSLMNLMLASDASARGEMPDDEYTRLQTEAGKNLKGVINPLDRNNFGGGSPLKEEAFLAEFQSLLDPEQRRKLDESLAKKAEANPPSATGIDQGNISNMPKMELEKLDTSIQSAKKITTGIKSMMEGFGGLKDLAPPSAPEGGGK